ncbi:MAG: AMP-binding protein, partial [Candidatus Hodarchaeota archaeon]
SGSAPLPDAVCKAFEQATGAIVCEGFGLTEASPVTHANPLNREIRRIGTIGFALSDTECRIVDVETGTKDMPLGEPGELIIKGPQLMKGYWNNPTETAVTLRDGWLYTGDIATVDEDGYYAIVDRKKDMIICSGFNVYPVEVEGILFEYPKIKEVAVIGVPDEKRGETVKAFVVLKEGETATEEEIIQWAKEHMAAYKYPRIIEFRDELPKTAVGKVLRKELKAEEEQKRK